MKTALYGLTAALGLLFAAMPSSTNYQLHNYGYGSGGVNGATSTNYGLQGTTGELSNQQAGSANYKLRAGNINTQQANVPPAPTFTNPADYYNKLKFVINTGNNPADALYTVAISSDNFVTTQYVQADDTLGSGKVYQTYAAWGGSGGQTVIGLQPGTTYALKVNAMQVKYTETEYGPLSSATTSVPSITFGLGVAATYQTTAPPYAASFGNLLPGVVTDTTDKIWLSFSTNAYSGGAVYLNSANAGLKSVARGGYTIASATADLSTASTGYGAQGGWLAQTSGGPLSLVAPYNGTAQNVGGLTTSLAPVVTSPGPISGGQAGLQLKAKVETMTPASSDYSDTLTFTAAAYF